MERAITDLVHTSHGILHKFGEENRADLLDKGMSPNGFQEQLIKFSLKQYGLQEGARRHLQNAQIPDTASGPPPVASWHPPAASWHPPAAS
jgi:hypothetical protein